MAKSNESPKPQFEMVEVSPQIGAANCKTEGGTLYRSGRLPINSEAADIWRQLVQDSGLAIDNHMSKFGVDVASATIAAYPMPHGTTGPGLAPVRINAHPKGTDTFTFYLSGVFEKHPQLRPVGKRVISIAPDVDQAGRPVALVSLASSLQTRTMPQDPAKAAQAKAEKAKRSRKRSKQDLPATNAAAAEQPAEQPEAKAE
jgi:hypothetical protein